MERQLEEIKSSFKQTIEKAGNKEELEKIRVEYLGRKGVLTTVLRKMGAIDPKERPRIGRLSNQLKSFMQESLSAKLKEMESAKGESGLDVTLPGRTIRRGRVHILNQVLAEIEDIFIDLGFSVVSGPEVEDAYHNFEALNMPLYHPARDMQATFYFSRHHLSK